MKTLILCLLCHLVWATPESCKINIYGNNSKPPKYWLDEKNEPRGILVDMTKAIGKKVNCEFNIILQPWKRAYRNAIDGEGAIIGLSFTKKRDHLFDYSDEVFVDNLIFVTLKSSNFYYSKISDLAGKTIGANRNSRYGISYEKAINEKLFKISPDSNPIYRLKKLLYKRVDAIIMGPGRISFETIIERDLELKKNKAKFVVYPKHFKKDPNYFAISKKMRREDIVIKFNKGLKMIKESGEYDQILKRYFNE